MKVALAHHRFAWVHPFSNGNGRVVRLLTYAMLIKYGFQVSSAGRLLNPAAVFCADRNRYYAMLSAADAGEPAELENWCTYVLSGIRDELEKVSRLADYAHLQNAVLLPAVAHARERQLITPQEEAVLQTTIRAGLVKAGDLERPCLASMPGSAPIRSESWSKAACCSPFAKVRANTRWASRTTRCCAAW